MRVPGLNQTHRGFDIRTGALLLVLTALWLWSFRSVYGYLSVIFTRDDFRTNQVLALGVIVLAWTRLRTARGGARGMGNASPQALALMLGGAAGYVAAERFAQVHLLSAALFAVASYGFLGLWLSPERWRAGLPAVLLLVGALPFGDVVDVLLGYPLRIATAAMVHSGLAITGVAAVPVDTILVFENGISQVDIPCSGVKGMWTGALFLIAATWLERRPLNARWLLTAVLFGLALIAFNAARVLALVVTGPVLGWRILAEMLHVPLGVLGFGAACGLCVMLLRGSPVAAGSVPASTSPPARGLSPAGTWGVVLALFVIALATPTPVSDADGTPAALGLEYATEVAVSPLPLAQGELAWLARDGAEAVERMRFDWDDRQGTMLLVQSRNWRAHHNPQRCFENSGLPVTLERTRLAAGAIPVRWLTLGDKTQTRATTAIYWFQSATQTSDDYGARFWSSLSLQPERWILVTILFDKPVDTEDEDDLDGLLASVHDTVRARLQTLASAGGTR